MIRPFEIKNRHGIFSLFDPEERVLRFVGNTLKEHHAKRLARLPQLEALEAAATAVVETAGDEEALEALAQILEGL